MKILKGFIVWNKTDHAQTNVLYILTYIELQQSFYRLTNNLSVFSNDNLMLCNHQVKGLIKNVSKTFYIQKSR